ncbi:hypothetical protein KIF24_01695 [Micromonospora sp. Llam7]|uniref:hypothetical protein n=1 Tax=Micromonospora tarapacensis TaxID=2835305 RepID=UPI001C838474|nr:hypothetical protein [Micromonospora tarapacensis]MBX7264891.1 hypothetical protein [Micromonospora tarapacensis]
MITSARRCCPACAGQLHDSAISFNSAHDRIALSVYLCGVLHEATADLYRLHPDCGPDPAAIFARFLAWVPGRRPATG